jgi:SAM-dependent methyltransferase
VKNPIVRGAESFSRLARARRARLFLNCFTLHENTRILDLGCGDGSHIHAVLAGTPVKPGKVHIADIDPRSVARGSRQYGFQPVVIPEEGVLPFPDGFFDIVYCSSVIEHVTLPKREVWNVRSGTAFRAAALGRQRVFAAEIRRLGKQYFVQTPNRRFPLESHSWLPFVSLLPRSLLVPLLRFTNTFWVKKTAPDWYLLDADELGGMFDDAAILAERSWGMTKSLIAVRSQQVRKGPEQRPAPAIRTLRSHA